MKKTIKTLALAAILSFSALSVTSCKDDTPSAAQLIAEAKSNAILEFEADVDKALAIPELSESVKNSITLNKTLAESFIRDADSESAVADALTSAKSTLVKLVAGAYQDCIDAFMNQTLTIEGITYNTRGSDDDNATYANDYLPILEGFIADATTVDGAIDAYDFFVEQTTSYYGSLYSRATGVYSFVSSSYDERMKIIAALEEYAMKNFLTGIPLFDDGGYAMYSETLKKGSDNYITGYGFGNLTEGQIVSDLSGESNADWKRYYHTYADSDDKTCNYADSKGSSVGTHAGYINGGYWDVRMNEYKDGYEWFNSLAKDKPIAVDGNEETGLATKYKWRIRTGADGFKYATNSSTFSAYNGREVQPEDYLTTYKMLYTQSNGYTRGPENLTGSGSIKGTAAYYAASETGYNETAWENVGLKVYQDPDDNEWYMSVEFNSPCNTFFCMYYMASAMTPPLPEDFVTNALGEGDWATGCKKWGVFDLDKGWTPVDTTLSTGAYVLERWDSESQIVWKRNDLLPAEIKGGENRYQIAGIHENILTAAQSDSEAALKEFLAGNLTSVGIPSTKLSEYKNDPRAVLVPGGTTYKLNVNACTQDQWDELFGTNGTVYQTSSDDYWVCEPMMSNTNFLYGVFFAIDRQEYASTLGRGAAIDYFGDDYLGDPENGVVYNESDYHKSSMEWITDINEYGYDEETSKQYFAKACAEMIAKGDYSVGDSFEVDIVWMSQAQAKTYGDPLKSYIEKAFNNCGGGLTITVNNNGKTNYMDCYYDMMQGQFDFGFGSISGNAYDPLNFMEVLKSDNSSGYTLNWSVDTSEVGVEYDGEMWSFDSLWQAGDTGGYFYNGEYVASFASDLSSLDMEENDDGSVTFTYETNMLTGLHDQGMDVAVSYIAFDGYNASGTYTEYDYDDFEMDGTVVSFTVPADDFASLYEENNYYYNAYSGRYGSIVMIDTFYNVTVFGVTTESYDTMQFGL